MRFRTEVYQSTRSKDRNWRQGQKEVVIRTIVPESFSIRSKVLQRVRRDQKIQDLKVQSSITSKSCDAEFDMEAQRQTSG